MDINKKAQAVIDRIEKATLHPILNKKAVEDAFRRQYKLLGVDFPKEVIWRDDLVLGFEYVSGTARDAARDAAMDAARGTAWDAARDAAMGAVWGAAWDTAWGAARGAVWGAAWDAAWGTAWDTAWGAARDAAWDASRDAVWDAAWGAARDAAWDAVWDAAAVNTGLKDSKIKKYIAIETEALKALENGLSWYFPMKDKLVLIPIPQFSFDQQNRLHAEDKAAIEWKSGRKFYYLSGVFFEEKLWKQVTSSRVTPKTILTLKNMEQRMATLKLKGTEWLLQATKAKKLGKSTRGNELYLIKDVFDTDAYFLKYTCPSTGRVYVSGVDPEVGKTKDSDASMAWKFSLTAEEYQKLTIES